MINKERIKKLLQEFRSFIPFILIIIIAFFPIFLYFGYFWGFVAALGITIPFFLFYIFIKNKVI